MAKEMIISANKFERKIAILEDGVLTEYYVERAGEAEGIAGNAYKGRVTRVLPGMQSAFVDVGLERDAFLYVSDVFEHEDVEVEFEAAKGPEAAEAINVEEIIEAIAEAKAPRPSRRRPAPEPTHREKEREYEKERDFEPEVAEMVGSIAREVAEAERELVASEHGSEEWRAEIEPLPPPEPPEAPEVDLKDALVEEKLIEAIHQEERQLEAVQKAPPVVESASRVGSLQIQFLTSSKRQRIMDEAPAVVAPSEEAARPSVAADGSPVEPEAQPLSQAPSASEESGPLAAREAAASATESGSLEVAPEGSAAEPDEPPLEDAQASVRQPRSRAEFANRRRVRRRRPPQSSAPAAAEPAPEEERNESKNQPTITELLQEGQDILVQIAKEPIGNKGARVTTHIALPGRYLVYMPTSEHIGVSRRISSPAERSRLRRLVGDAKAKNNVTGGLIVRTAADGMSEGELVGDLQYLVRTWTDIRARADRAKSPKLIHRDLDLVERILRDRLSHDFTAIRVDDEDDFARILDFVSRFQPKLLNRVKLHTRDTPIFEEYGIQAEIEKSIRPRVWLKSGGYIVINQTEALVAIDVNTGKFVGKTGRFEDTITKTNIEAAKEIARQLRLRDLGGIIVLDFIDMEERKNRARVMQVLEEELKKDRAPTKILQFNDFGLVAITRKRVKQSLERTLCEPCPYCHGSGMVKSPQTVCLEILDEARRLATTQEIKDGKELILRLHPEVAKALRTQHTRLLEEIETYLGSSLTVKTDPLLHQEQFDIAVV
jgi:ribonuclease G